jgi:transposase InsO family protein
MIVVKIDNFSRFVDLYPISNTSAEAAAAALLIQFTGRFKTPIQFTTDSGSNFASDLMKGLTAHLGAQSKHAANVGKNFSHENQLVGRVFEWFCYLEI